MKIYVLDDLKGTSTQFTWYFSDETLRRQHAVALRIGTTQWILKLLDTVKSRVLLATIMAAWREPAWRSRKAIRKSLNSLSYRVALSARRRRLLMLSEKAVPPPPWTTSWLGISWWQ